MKQKPSAHDVLSDIEFELIQSAVSHDELGQAIQAIRRYQNQMREEIVETAHPRDRGALARLLQVNDMLMVVVQELVAAIRSLRFDLRRMGLESLGSSVDPSAPDRNAGLVPSAPDLTEETVELENVMRREALGVEIEARPVSIPLLGPVLQRLRAAVHGLALFYTRMLAERQTVVNQTYGEAILRLVDGLSAQQRQIEVLKDRIATLETQQATNGSSAVDSQNEEAGSE